MDKPCEVIIKGEIEHVYNNPDTKQKVDAKRRQSMLSGFGGLGQWVKASWRSCHFRKMDCVSMNRNCGEKSDMEERCLRKGNSLVPQD